MTLPARLLKFAPEPRFLENGMFRFTQPSELNDPHEAFPGLLVDQYAREDIEAVRVKARKDGHGPMSDEQLITFYLTPYPARRFDEKAFPGLWPQKDARLREEPFSTMAEHDQAVAERAIDLAVAFANRTVGIFSLSERSDETMWAHYASDHHGVCIHFDPAHAFFRDGAIRPVVYSEQPIHVTVNHGWVRFGGYKLSEDALFENRLDFFPEEILWRKRGSWAYEREWRMAKSLADAERVIQPNGANTPAICLFSIPPDAVTGITFGLRASDALVEQTLERVANDARWNHLFLRRRRKAASGIVESAMSI